MVYSVFISSTSKDLQPYRQAVHDAILRLENRPIDMKYFLPGDGDATEASLNQVAQAEIFVGIIARRYGYVPDDSDISVTHQEFREAERLKIPRLMFLLADDYKDWDATHDETDETKKEKLLQFKQEIMQLVVTWFTTPEDLGSKVTAALANKIKDLDEAKRKKRDRYRWLLPGFSSLALLTIIGLAFVFSALLQPQPPTVVPTTPTVIPFNPGRGTFNVAVADFGLIPLDGNIPAANAATAMSQVIADNLAEIDGVAVRSVADGLPIIPGTNPNDRQTHAQELAKQLRADIVIYGDVRQISDGGGLYGELQLEIYLSSNFVDFEEGFGNIERFTPPIRYLLGDNNPEAIAEVSSLVLSVNNLVLGFGDYLTEDYVSALLQFETAAASAQIPVLYVLGGNTALRLDRDEYALDLYTRALNIPGEQDYARALHGRGQALARLARTQAIDDQIPYDATVETPDNIHCLDELYPEALPQIVMDQVIQCYNEAAISLNQVPEADVDVKVPYAASQLYLWRADNNYGDYWDLARQSMEQVITIYEGSETVKQHRIGAMAGHTYHRLYWFAPDYDNTNPQDLLRALELEVKAIAALRQDIDFQYNQSFIESYCTNAINIRTQLNSLDNPGQTLPDIPDICN